MEYHRHKNCMLQTAHAELGCVLIMDITQLVTTMCRAYGSLAYICSRVALLIRVHSCPKRLRLEFATGSDLLRQRIAGIFWKRLFAIASEIAQLRVVAIADCLLASSKS